MKNYIFDVEADSLTPTRIWVLSWHNIDTNKSGSITDYSEMKRFLLQRDMTLIGHNIISWDIPILERLLEIKISARLVDTLALSWYLYPKRDKHGLGLWGEDLGVSKPVIETWTELPIEDYINRCEEDVKINLLLFEKQLALLKLIYDDDMPEIKRLINYLCYKMDCALEQSNIKWLLDKTKCQTNLILFEREFIRKEEILATNMPENILYKVLNKPKKFLKKDKTVGALGEKWLSLLADLGLEQDYDEPLMLEKKRETGNPASHKQLKDWLFELGWSPITFKYEKKEDGKMRKIPQVSLPRGKGLCPSVKRLYEVEPILRELDMLYVIKHRVGLFKGFLRDVDSDGYLQAKVAGLTNTLRFKHSVIVNLPGVTGTNGWRDGKWVRELLTVKDGYVLCGSDVSSLEDQTKKHLMYYFDPEFVKEMNTEGYDAHLALAEFAQTFTKGKLGISPEDIKFYKEFQKGQSKTRLQEIKNERHIYKTLNYSSVYGVGATTMSRSLGFPIEQCRDLLEVYWKKNWAVKEIAKALTVKKIGNQMWLQNPVSKFWYSLRSMKDRFSTCNQGLGVYVFDMWIKNCRNKGIKMAGQFHDEACFPVLIGREKEIENILRTSMEAVNTTLSLNVKVEIDVQFGINYASVH